MQLKEDTLRWLCPGQVLIIITLSYLLAIIVLLQRKALTDLFKSIDNAFLLGCCVTL